MKQWPLTISMVAVTLLLSCCAIGTSTTQRSALPRPAIEPDGTFWDAVTVARKRDGEAFRYLLSPQMIYRALYPEAKLAELDSQKDFNAERTKIEAELAKHEPIVQSMATRYMEELDKLLEDRLVEVSKPSYTIKYKDDYGRAAGPNTARVTVTVYPKDPMADGAEPETVDVRFIMDGRRWLINGFDNDKLKGAFVR